MYFISKQKKKKKYFWWTHSPDTKWNNVHFLHLLLTMLDIDILAGQFLCDESIVVDSHKLVVQLRPHPPHLQNKLLAAPTVEMISWEKKFLISSSQKKSKRSRCEEDRELHTHIQGCKCNGLLRPLSE